MEQAGMSTNSTNQQKPGGDTPHSSLERTVGERMSEPTMAQELSLLAGRVPDFAGILTQAAKRGELAGYAPQTQIIAPAGELYWQRAWW